MSSDLVFIHDDVLSDVADAIRFVEGSSAGIAPEDYADHIKALDKLILQPDVLNFYMPNGGTISLNKIGSPTVVELEYWLDDNHRWVVWQPDNNGNRSLVLSAGQRMYVRNTSNTQTMFSTSNSNYYNFAFTGNVEAHGNTNSLLCKNAESVTSAHAACFFRLFYNCTSLLTAPELPSTTISSTCYANMFTNCTSLVTALELPATTLSGYAYYQMFYNCTQLQEIRTIMTNISFVMCLEQWLTGVAAQGDFYCPAELTIPTGASGIPSGWTRKNIQDTIPLNFTMPNGGTITLTKNGTPTEVALEYSIDGGKYWTEWIETNNVRTLTLNAGEKVYIRNKSATQTGFSTSGDNFYNFAFTNTIEAHGNINSLLCKNAENVTSLSALCYSGLFFACAYLVTAPELPATTLVQYCYYYMFQDCTSLVTAPELPATTLAFNCYRRMFSGCTRLQEIRTRMTDISASDCLFDWLSNVSAQGDLYCPAELTISTGGSGIPSGWTRHDI